MSEIMRNELGTSYPLRGFKYLIGGKPPNPLIG